MRWRSLRWKRTESNRAWLRQAPEIGSPERTRTSDPVINSHLLYRLSYRGMEKFRVPACSRACRPGRQGRV